MQHAFLRRAHDHRLGFLERRRRLVAIAGGNRLLDLAQGRAQARAARLVDFGAPRDDPRRLLG